jgi:hypothetical protein
MAPVLDPSPAAGSTRPSFTRTLHEPGFFAKTQALQLCTRRRYVRDFGGTSSRGRVLVVSHAERGENVRIISARFANARERREYGK